MLNGKDLCYLFFFFFFKIFLQYFSLFCLWSWVFSFFENKKDGSTDTQIEMFSYCQRSLKKIKAASQMEDTCGRGHWGQKWGLSGGAGHFDPPVFSFSVKISVWYIEMAAFLAQLHSSKLRSKLLLVWYSYSPRHGFAVAAV